MAVSASTLFHFTSKESLFAILRGGFHPCYSLEDLSNATPAKSIYKDAYIPMVCFCDLRFSQISDHIDFYGEYGLGLRKHEWGIAKGISPIIYVPPGSISAKQIQSIATEIASRLDNVDDRTAIRKELQNFYKYVKPYSGKIKNRKTNKIDDKVFYDEREWRYVPSNFPVLSKSRTPMDRLERKSLHIRKSDVLTFDAKDVKYIIVKDEAEIPDFATYIEERLTHFVIDDRKLLVSKLISAEQIRTDM